MPGVLSNATLAQAVSDLIAGDAAMKEEFQTWLNGTVAGGPNSDGRYPLTDYQGNTALYECPAKMADMVDNNVSGALAHKNAAQAAQTAAEAAQAAAEAASTSAGLFEDDALAHKNAAEAAQTAADSAKTVSIAQAVVSTNQASYSQEWANKALDTLVSAAAGGDQVDDYSAMHHAHYASLDAAAAAASAASAAADAAAAATFNPALYAALADNETVTGQYTFSHASGILIGAAPLTAALIGQWNTAYGWGDHASAGYALLTGAAFSGNVTAPNINAPNWDAAYSWGDHGAVGYAKLSTLSQSDTYLFLNRNNANPALYVMKDSTTGGPVAKFGSGTMNTTTFGGGAFEIQANGGFTADGEGILRAAAGGTAIYLDSTANESGAGLNLPALRWREADGTSVAGIRAYQDAGSLVQSLRLGTGWFNEKLILSSDDAHLLTGSLKITGDTTEGLWLQGINPSIRLTDTTTAEDDFWIHVNSNNFYVLADRTDSGSWAGPHPLQLEADTNIGYIFGKRVTLHNEAHYVSGSALGITAVTGQYGAIQTTGTTGGYGGISLDGNFALMNSGASHVGLYNDVHNEWFMLCYPNSYVNLYYNGVVALQTQSYSNVRCGSTYGYIDVGPQNTSWAHMTTDRANFYFNKGASFAGQVKYYNLGAYFYNGSSSYASGKVTFSTSAATGGSSGDIWYQYT